MIGRALPVILVSLACATSACAARVFVPPSGPGQPAPGAATAWTEATSACREVKDATGTLHVTFRRGRGSLGMDVGFVATADGKVRLESNVFTLAGTAAKAQLLLKQDQRFVEARAEDIVDAFVGVRLSPERLLSALTGCMTTAVASARPDAAVRYDKLIRIPVSDGTVFLRRRDNQWRVSAGEGNGIRIEYRSYEGYWPRTWRASASVPTPDPIVLDVTVNEIERNKTLDPAAFTIDTGGATPMTLEDLRAAGPLRGKGL